MDRGHARYQPAEVYLGLRADGIADILAGAADSVLAQGDPDHVGQDVGAPTGAHLFHAALQRTSVLRQDSNTLVRRKEAQPKGATLATDLQIAAAQDEAGPGEAK